MNRAQKRLFDRRNRPSGEFVSEFGARKMNREYQDALRSQMEREANGEPVSPEIAEKMTKARETEDLWQVGVTPRGNKQVKYLGPMMAEDAVRGIVAAVNTQITSGQRRDWVHAEAYPMTRIAQGA